MEKNKFNTEERKIKLLKPKIDVVFHALFREENKELLEGFISDILQEKVKVATTDKNRYVNTKQADEKLGIMDLRAELENGVQCNVEIQLQPKQYNNERILYYWADTYARQLKRGDEYVELNKTISIVILGYEIDELNGFEKMGVKWKIRDGETGKRLLTDNLEIIIIELPKAIRIYGKDRENRILQWMMFLNNPNKKEVVQIMKENKTIRKAIEELERVSGEERLQRIAELREKAIRDEKAAMDYAKEHGFKEGFENGKIKGYEEGREQGLEQGIQQGIEEKREIVKKMLEKNMTIKDISEITGFNEEEIEYIKES